MRRRPRLAAIFVVLVVLGSVSFGSPPADHAYGADPLTEAQANERALQETLASQQRDLADLKSLSATLDARLAAAEAELAAVGAEYERVAGLLFRSRTRSPRSRLELDALRARIATLDEMLVTLAIEVERQNRELEAREALLQDHYRDAYERSQTSLLEILLAADSFESVATQVGYLMTVSEQDAALADEIRVARAGWSPAGPPSVRAGPSWRPPATSKRSRPPSAPPGRAGSAEAAARRAGHRRRSRSASSRRRP